jgi:hypothetical protein
MTRVQLDVRDRTTASDRARPEFKRGFMLRIVALSIILSVSVGESQAWAWGCEGHQAIAIAAERLLPAPTRALVNAVLAASPIDPMLRRFCESPAGSPLGDSATWADDFRDVEPATGAWHFINIPRAVGDHTGDYKRYCTAPPSPGGAACIVDALVAQYRTLTTTRDRRLKADALRFIVHFAGDIHQPLHAITNGDRGGNCFPVTVLDETPQADDRHNWRPNLHAVWDVELVRGLMRAHRLGGSSELATFIAAARVNAAPPTASSVAGWARESNALGRRIAYGKLPAAAPVEPAYAVARTSCDDNNHVGSRMAALDEHITRAYQQASQPAVVNQLRLAAERLASMLQAAFPP